jgi:GTP-binding protein
LYVVNKVDGRSQETAATEFYALGVERLYTVSAEHGRGIDDLMQAVIEALPAPAKVEAGNSDETRLAVIGRPNVGKSSLINRMIGVERLVANPTAGTTRDSIDTPFIYNKKRYVLIDTAGIRRKGRVQQKLEKYSVIQSLKAMERAHVVLMVLDAEEGVTEQDLTIAGYALERGRAVLLVVNKWDLVKKDQGTMKQFTEKVRHAFKFLPFAPIIYVSALSGQRVSKIMSEVEKVACEFNRQVPTAALNRVLEEAVLSHAPPLVQGKPLKFYYMTQTGVRPPSFVVFGNRTTGVHFSYERYLSNKLREAFGFQGCPIRLKFKNRSGRD